METTYVLIRSRSRRESLDLRKANPFPHTKAQEDTHHAARLAMAHCTSCACDYGHDHGYGYEGGGSYDGETFGDAIMAENGKAHSGRKTVGSVRCTPVKYQHVSNDT